MGEETRSRRRSSYRSLASLQRDNRACRACAQAGYPIFYRPVLEGHVGQRAMLIGQAPGEQEGIEGRPWRGRAGRTLRSWLGMDEDTFYATFYCCSVTRCYPGKSPGGRGDRVPTPEELELCSFWLAWERRLLRPRLIVTVGGLAARRVLGIRRLSEEIGVRRELGEAVAVSLPHPSGASGWLNPAENRERLRLALGVVATELRRLG
jgi:uracil-DNA glycosylase